VIELAILGLLKERTMHGYQLKKRLSETLGPFWQVSYGSLYPALKRLQKEGAVEMVFPREDVGRRKNVYRLTERGEVIFRELLAETGNDTGGDNGFRVRLAFFRYLKPETRIGVLERRRAVLMERLVDLRGRVTSFRERADSYTLSLMRHGMDTTEHDLQWVNDMIRAEVRASRGQKSGRRAARVPRRAAKEGAE
jgi:DNA-binding PadR family transcriptional regulator